jgi:hypothetical protein
MSDALPMPVSLPTRPAAGSWVDWLLGRFRAAPWPAPLTAGVAIAGLFGVFLVERAATGRLAATGYDLLYLLVEVTYPVVYLLALHLLDDVALRAVDTARPVLTLDDAAIATLGADLTRTPRPAANVALALGVALGVASVVSSPAAYGLSADSPAALWAETFVLASSVTVSAVVFVAHALHQLRLVRRVSRDHVTVDLFHLQPLYAFATLTSWTGIALLATTGWGLGSQGVLTGGVGLNLSSVDVVAAASIFGVAIASFVVPLLGLRDRIVAAKRRELARATASLQAAIEVVNARLAAPDGADLTQAKSGIEAATGSLAAIRAISTWPWRQETLRGFASALGLPIVVWLVQRLLSTFVAFR